MSNQTLTLLAGLSLKSLIGCPVSSKLQSTNHAAYIWYGMLAAHCVKDTHPVVDRLAHHWHSKLLLRAQEIIAAGRNIPPLDYGAG